MSVYSPWFRKWVAIIHNNEEYLKESSPPHKNPPMAGTEFERVFQESIPMAPSSHALTTDDRRRFAALWPCGEHAAQERLDKFCSETIGGYAKHRSEPGSDATSCLSVHLSQGTISARECVRRARDSNSSNKLDKGYDGVVSWISEVAWRDFYRRTHSIVLALISRCPGCLATCLQESIIQKGVR
jgi:deoxyribodipyrimidine photo-lyase